MEQAITALVAGILSAAAAVWAFFTWNFKDTKNDKNSDIALLHDKVNKLETRINKKDDEINLLKGQLAESRSQLIRLVTAIEFSNNAAENKELHQVAHEIREELKKTQQNDIKY